MDGVATNCENIVAPLGSLITVYRRGNQPAARFAHLSVEEYLCSGRLRDGSLAEFHIDINTAHTEVAKTCLRYLSLRNFQVVDPNQRYTRILTLFQQYQLYIYAAISWYRHLRESKICNEEFQGSVLPLLKVRYLVFENRPAALSSWQQLPPSFFYLAVEARLISTLSVVRSTIFQRTDFRSMEASFFQTPKDFSYGRGSPISVLCDFVWPRSDARGRTSGGRGPVQKHIIY